MPTRLSSLRPGEHAIISAIHAEQGLYQRLTALGFRIGKRIDLIRRGPCSGPVQVRIGHTDIVLRLSEAKRISIHRSASP